MRLQSAPASTASTAPRWESSCGAALADRVALRLVFLDRGLDLLKGNRARNILQLLDQALSVSEGRRLELGRVGAQLGCSALQRRDQVRLCRLDVLRRLQFRHLGNRGVEDTGELVQSCARCLQVAR